MKLPQHLLLTLLGAGMAHAGTISVNFVDAAGTDDMLPADIAGTPDFTGTRVANWNNVQSGATGEATALVRETGAATTAGLNFTSNLGTYRLPTTLDDTSTGDDRMWKGYLDAAGTAAAPGTILNVTDIPFTGFYDVYIYLDGDNGGNWRVASFQATSGAPAVTASGEDSESTNWGAGQNTAKVFQIPAPGAGGNLPWPVSPNNNEGNMVILKGMKGASLTLKAWGSGGDISRAPINGFQIVESNDNDLDGDGMSNDWETAHNLNPQSAVGADGASGDPDGDGLTNVNEFARGTDPHNPDTDGDGLNDKVENGSGNWVSATDTGTNPLNPDTDGDGLTDKVETKTGNYLSATDTGTDPFATDSDGDGYSDGDEVTLKTNPLDINSVPALPLLLGRWTFDDQDPATVADLAPTPHPGTINGGAVYTEGRTGKAGDHALIFDGIDDSVTTGASLLNNLNTWSVTGWIRVPVAPAGARIGLFGQNDVVEFGFIDADTVNIWANGGASFDVPNGVVPQWTHIAAVGDNGTVTLYIGGVQQATGPISANSGSSTFGFNIGGGGIWDGTGNFFKGEIDDVSVWRGPLTAQQVADLAKKDDLDDDGMPDAWEDANGLSKSNPADAALDADQDGLTNLEEFLRSTDPRKKDTDGDGLSDKVETGGGIWTSATETGTNPLVADTDGDGLSDAVETNTTKFVSATDTGTDPFLKDTDTDGFADGDEVLLRTDPNDAGSVPAWPLVLGYWPFDDQNPATTADVSPVPHAGTVNGEAVYVPGHTGKPGDHALSFDGVDDSVTTGASLLNGLSSWTVAGWIRIPNALTTTRIGLFGQNDVVEFGLSDADTIMIWANGSAFYDIPGGTLPEWTHIAAVSDAGAVSLYINGVSQSTGTVAAGTSTFGFNIGGGGIWDVTGNFFTGDIDDVAVWKGVLTAEQVADLATGKAVPAGGSAPVPASFAISSVTRTATTLTLTWPSDNGASYTVKRSNVTNSGWTAVGTLTATGTTSTWTDNSPPAGRAFYYIQKN